MSLSRSYTLIAACLAAALPWLPASADDCHPELDSKKPQFNKPDAVHLPTERFPIVQSYVDIFITGCMQLSPLAVAYDGDFAEACIETTSGWSEYWVNDRLYPRRPFIYQPNASQVDALLYRLVPEIQSVRIE